VLRRRFLGMATGLLAGGAAGFAARAQGQVQTALRLSVHPYNSALALTAAHRPLFQYLERELQQPVEFYTAPGFEAYVASLMNGEYDITICPPHFALLAMEKNLYTAVAHYKTRLDPLLVVRSDSPFHAPADFAGKRIAMADKLALIRIVAVKWLADAGLVAGRDYQIIERPTHGASITATVLGEADAGLATTTAFKQVPVDIQQRLRLVSTGYQFPHLFTLVKGRQGNPLAERVKKALLGFTPELPEGREFFDKTAYRGFEPVRPEAITALKPLLEPTRDLVGTMR